MQNQFRILFLTATLLFASLLSAHGQADTTFKPHGQLWGCAFGDFSFKGNADPLNRDAGINQYSAYPINNSMFQYRRIYLGLNYFISPKFTAELVLSSENDYAAGVLNQPSNGDLLVNSKFTEFIKYANIRWKNIWKGTDLVMGQVNTPAYGINGRNSQTPEEVWGYRSVERTISDIRGTPCYDMGAELQGWFDSKGNFGYDLMAGNGPQAKPETDAYKWFYANAYAKFFDKKLIIDLYQDYERLNWGVYTAGPHGPWYHDRNMTKLFVAYTTTRFTAGFEGFRNTIMGDVKVTGNDGYTWYATTRALAAAVFVRGRILSDHQGNARLGFFARMDNYDPSGNLGSILNNSNTRSYTATSTFYDPTTREQFVLLGLDYTPFRNVHFMPNIWANMYHSTLSPGQLYYTGVKGTDLVWRLTFFYLYGK